VITEANIPNLLRCVRNNEEAKGFYLGRWITVEHECGTIGCLVGNDWLALGHEPVVPGCTVNEWALMEYALKPGVGRFLFGESDIPKRPGLGIATKSLWPGEQRDQHDREAALARLRKFIYYVLHKRELLYDDSGRIRETARRAEGNHMILRSVRSAVERAATNVNREFSVTQ
jgi:hypothetical protein